MQHRDGRHQCGAGVLTMPTVTYHFALTVASADDELPASADYLADHIARQVSLLQGVDMARAEPMTDPVQLTTWERVYLKNRVRTALTALESANMRRAEQQRPPQELPRIATLTALLRKLEN